MYGYDQPLREYIKTHSAADPKRGGSYANIPLEMLLPYAAADAYATHIVEGILFQELTDAQRI